MGDALRRRVPLGGEWRVDWPDGSVHVLRGSGHVLRDGAGRPLRLAGVCWDVSEQCRLRQQLEEQHELLEVTLQSIADAVLATDAQGRVTWLNPVAWRLTGWTANEARGQPAQLPPGAVLRGRDGVRRAVDVLSLPSAARPAGCWARRWCDVTQQRRQFDEIRWRASHDALTGLVNRAEFGQRLAHLRARASRRQPPCAAGLRPGPLQARQRSRWPRGR